MGNGTDNVFERLYKLLIMIGKMVMDGVRNAEEVADWLQVVVARPDFKSILEAPRAASVSTEPAGGWADDWTQFYQEVFGLTVDLNGVPIPEQKPGFGWVLMMAPGLTLNQAWAKCGERFPVNSFVGEDFDRLVKTNTRTTEQAYARRLRNRVEADEETKNTSARQLAEREVEGNTLLEAFVLELWYHWKTGGGHLNLLTVNLCAGSRYADGKVPGVDWYEGEFQVDTYYPDRADDGLRTRVAVQ